MLKTFFKISGERLTPEEANEAKEVFLLNGGLPENYEFKHWSSSAIKDEEIQELNDGGEGLLIDRTQWIYPVIALQPIVISSKSGTTLYYDIKTTSFTKVSPQSGKFLVYSKTGYIGEDAKNFTFAQSNIVTSSTGSKTSIYNSSAANVDFGVITLPANSSDTPSYTKAYTIVSDTDNETYCLKFEVVYESGTSLVYATIFKRNADGSLSDLNENSILLYRSVISNVVFNATINDLVASSDTKINLIGNEIQCTGGDYIGFEIRFFDKPIEAGSYILTITGLRPLVTPSEDENFTGLYIGISRNKSADTEIYADAWSEVKNGTLSAHFGPDWEEGYDMLFIGQSAVPFAFESLTITKQI